MASELSLEQIAEEIAATRSEPKSNSTGKYERPVGLRRRAELTTSLRFGEIIESFLRCGTVRGVARELDMSTYVLHKHFFANPEFCKLLRTANEQIFLEATQSIRDEQGSMLHKAQRLAQEALDEMETLLHESESEHVRFKVAQDLLDRDPRISRTKRIESTGVNVTIEQKVLMLAMETASEIEASDPTTVLTEGARVSAEVSQHSSAVLAEGAKSETASVNLPTSAFTSEEGGL